MESDLLFKMYACCVDRIQTEMLGCLQNSLLILQLRYISIRAATKG